MLLRGFVLSFVLQQGHLISFVLTNKEQDVHRLYPDEYFSAFEIFSPVYLVQIPLQT